MLKFPVEFCKMKWFREFIKTKIRYNIEFMAQRMHWGKHEIYSYSKNISWKQCVFLRWFHGIFFEKVHMNPIWCTVWKLQKFSLTEKKFRQINYLVISLVKPLLSRNFCEKVWERISEFSTLCDGWGDIVTENFHSHLLNVNFQIF